MDGRASPPVKAVRSTALVRDADPTPKFGPVVEIVSVTAVVPAPTAIDDGLNSHPVNSGRFSQAKLTAELNLTPPTGAAENV